MQLSKAKKPVCSELPKIKKGASVLTDSHYQTPKTSLLTFCFEPHAYSSTGKRLEQCQVKSASIDGKDVYIIDGFFNEAEEEEVRAYSGTTTFSRDSYGSPEAIEKGEKPARSMDGKERWQFFSNPSSAMNELYKLFGLLSEKLNAEVTTLPWELCDEAGHGSPSVIGNFLEEASFESMDLGKHQDCNPMKGLPFAIPILYVDVPASHPAKFINGDKGNPWVVTVMLYAHAENFQPEFRMGTAYYDKNKKIVLRSASQSMRMVLFEGDIFHTIEESRIPENEKTWRVSYVFKLVLNPKKRDLSVKQRFAEIMSKSPNKPEKLTLGQDTRI